MANAALERDVEKFKTLNNKLRQEMTLQGNQVILTLSFWSNNFKVTSLGEKLLKAETEVMEKADKVRSLEKKLAEAPKVTVDSHVAKKI